MTALTQDYRHRLQSIRERTRDARQRAAGASEAIRLAGDDLQARQAAEAALAQATGDERLASELENALLGPAVRRGRRLCR